MWWKDLPDAIPNFWRLQKACALKHRFHNGVHGVDVTLQNLLRRAKEANTERETRLLWRAHTMQMYFFSWLTFCWSCFPLGVSTDFFKSSYFVCHKTKSKKQSLFCTTYNIASKVTQFFLTSSACSINVMDARWRRNEATETHVCKLSMSFKKLKYDKIISIV